MNKPPRPKTKPINPILFLILGGGIFAYAIFISIISNGKNNNILYLFAGIGALFFIVGLVRFLKNKSEFGDSLKKEEAAITNNFIGVKPKVDSNLKRIVICKQCSTKNYSTSNFCHMCGARLK